MISSVTRWLDESAKQYPDKCALCDIYESLTFQEYRNNALAIAGKIISMKLGSKMPVAVYMPKNVRSLVAFAGIAYSGCFYSPIDVEMPEARVLKTLDILRPSIIVTDSAHKAKVQGIYSDAAVVVYEDSVSWPADEAIVLAARDKTIDCDLLYVLFTSGSTGSPKGVCITHRSVIDYIDWVTETFDITHYDSFGNQSPFYFDNSVLDIYTSMKTAASCYIISTDLFAQPVRLLEFLKNNKITTIFWVPSAMMIVSKLRAFKNVDLRATLKRVLFAGEVMPCKYLNDWRSHLPGCVYANLYGPTEITVDCTCYVVDRIFEDSDSLPIGKATRNTDVMVLDENDLLIGPECIDVIGELCVRGTSLAVGYWNDTDKTRKSFVQNPLNDRYDEKIYRTGDLVRYNELGELMYIGRKDSQIKHMGHRIELGEIEAAALSIPNVLQCCCLYDTSKSRIVLFVEGDLKDNDINEKLKNVLPAYMLPAKIAFVESMPLNSNGKIDRVRMRDLI